MHAMQWLYSVMLGHFECYMAHDYMLLSGSTTAAMPAPMSLTGDPTAATISAPKGMHKLWQLI